MAQPLVDMPSDGWTVDDLDALPESHLRHELTDGALTVTPSPSSLHQIVAGHLMARLEASAPEPLVVTQAVEIRFGPQLTRIPDVLVVRSDDPGRHWFAPSEVVVAVEIESPGSHVEDRVTKPALYARHGIEHYWRLELDPPRMSVHRSDGQDGYLLDAQGGRLAVAAPFAVDLAVTDLIPRWAREG